MTEEYAQHVLRVVVSKICQTIGWHSIRISALDLLVDILHRYLRDVSKETCKYTELYGRTEPNLNDIGLVFHNRGINLSNINDYIKNVGQINCRISVPQYSNDKNLPLEFTQPSTEEIYTRPLHIYNYLPSIYPEEKCKDIEKQPPVVMNQVFHYDERIIDPTSFISGPIHYSELPDNIKTIMKSCDRKVPYDTETIMKVREGKLPASKSSLSPIKKVRIRINQKKNQPKIISKKKKTVEKPKKPIDAKKKSPNQIEILSIQVIKPPNLPPLLIEEPVLSEHEEDTIPSIFKVVETGEPMKDTSADNTVLQKLPVIGLGPESSNLRPISTVINIEQVISNEMSNIPISTNITNTCSVKSQHIKKKTHLNTFKKKYIKQKLDQENKEIITTNKRLTRNSVKKKIPKIKLKILREFSSHQSDCIDGEIPITAKVVSNSKPPAEEIPYNIENISPLKLKISKQYSPENVSSTTPSSHNIFSRTY